jgi:hypothetical protein
MSEKIKPCKTGNYKHGYSVTHPRLFGVWESMRSRCNNPNREKYKDYGARGIKVCDEWQMSAKAFCEWSLANGYSEGLQLDRIDNDKGYSPDNCRWVTPKQNSRNRRNTVMLNVNGTTKSVAEWCETINVSPFTIYWWVKSKGVKYAETRLSELA